MNKKPPFFLRKKGEYSRQAQSSVLRLPKMEQRKRLILIRSTVFQILNPKSEMENGGEGGIRTHGTPFGRTADFESAPLQPLRYLSVRYVFGQD